MGVVWVAGYEKKFCSGVVQGIGARGGEVGDEVGNGVWIVQVGGGREGGEGFAWSVAYMFLR